jgi:hypothetical protein
MPLTSLVLEPRQGQLIVPDSDGTIVVRGVAWGGITGNPIAKVEVCLRRGASAPGWGVHHGAGSHLHQFRSQVSTDQKTWHPATLRPHDIPRDKDQSSRAWYGPLVMGTTAPEL